METLKNAIFNFINLTAPGRLITGLYLLIKNHLNKSGWMKSHVRRMAITKNGEAIPWLTYSIIYFLEPRLHKSLSVFEYGSGNSTKWFSKHVKNITSVEHDANWYAKMKPVLESLTNVTYLNKGLKEGGYSSEIASYANAFDIIVVDGRERVACAKNALGALKEGGVIIWDNADRPEYKEGYDYLLSHGFKRIDFYGMVPISVHQACTTIFYKPVNCLGL